MKVNFGTKGQLQIINIFSGGTFTTPRSNGVGMGMYLKIDSNNNRELGEVDTGPGDRGTCECASGEAKEIVQQ